MQLLLPEMLADMRELPLMAALTLALTGWSLLSLGWWAHRFWLVLGATLAAGLAGLRLGPEFGIQPVVAGLLSAVAAGVLALSLVRVAVFAGCGLGCWFGMQALLPQFAEPLVCILAGGLCGVLFVRLWIITLTSAAGTLLLSYSGLVLAERVARFDAVRFATENRIPLNIGFGVVILSGVIGQYLFERLRKRFQEWRKGLKEYHSQAKESPEAPKNRWLRFFRKAA